MVTAKCGTTTWALSGLPWCEFSPNCHHSPTLLTNVLLLLSHTHSALLHITKHAHIAETMQTKIWVNSQTGQLHTSHFTAILQKLFASEHVAGLGIRQWRQAAVAITDAHLKSSKPTVDIFAQQRGHTRVTANSTYGGSWAGIDRDTEDWYKLASYEYHRFWNVSLFLISWWNGWTMAN